MDTNYSDLVDAALNIAARSDDLSHLIRVASRLDGVAKIVGCLHDSVEDGYASESELRDVFPAEVVDAVMVVTRRDGEVYADYIERVRASGDAVGLEVKLADLQVNLARARVDRYTLVPRYTTALARLTS